MEGNVVDQVTLTGSMVSYDLSILGLFLKADIVVKVVILMLIAASFWCWTIIFDKLLRMRNLNRKANRFDALVRRNGNTRR